MKVFLTMWDFYWNIFDKVDQELFNPLSTTGIFYRLKKKLNIFEFKKVDEQWHVISTYTGHTQEKRKSKK